MRAVVVLTLIFLAGCATALAPETQLVRGPLPKRAVVIVADATLAAEARATTKFALDVTIELARGDDMATGVLAATAEGARVVSPLGDAGPVALDASDGAGGP